MKLAKLLSVIAAIGLLLLVTGCERKVVNQASNNDNASLQGCFACHGETSLDGAILQAQGEWQHSVHASGTNVDYTNRDKSDCQQCHDHQGFVQYITTGSIDTLAYSVASAIHCFTCHAPHTNGNLDLRTKAPYTLKNGVVFDHGSANLCANCHHVRSSLASNLGSIDTLKISSRWGPHHSMQADMVQGTHGYEFAGFQYHVSLAHRGSTKAACLDCHMGDTQEHDGYKIGGHSFNMVDEETGVTMVKTCQASGCHPASQVAKLDAKVGIDLNENGKDDGYQTEIESLLDSLRVLLVNYGDNDSLLTLQSGAWLPYNNKWVTKDEAGAVWNFLMVEDDRSEGIHNPKYIADLLKSSIDYAKTRQ